MTLARRIATLPARVRAAALAWRSADPTVRELRERAMGGGVAAGVEVNPRSALTLTAVYSAVNRIATDVACLPLKLYQRLPDGSKVERPDHPSARLWRHSPDGRSTPMRWRQAIIGHMLTWGNGYALVSDTGGDITKLSILAPGSVRAEVEDGEIVYAVGAGTKLPSYRVVHLAGLSFDGLTGYSPVSLARQAIGLGLAAETFGSSFFGNGSRPGGVLKLKARLKDDEARERLRAGWEDAHGGPANYGRLAILEEGADFAPFTIPPEDAQFLQTRQFQVVEIARLYGIPPHKIGDYSQSHLANIEAANLDYMITVIMPWCEAIEQEFNHKLLTEDDRNAGLFFEHQMQAFMRGDMKSRAEFYVKMRDLGAFTPNMILGLENFNGIGPAGDTRLVPLNMVSLDAAGRPPAPASAPQPEAAADDA